MRGGGCEGEVWVRTGRIIGEGGREDARIPPERRRRRERERPRTIAWDRQDGREGKDVRERGRIRRREVKEEL